jgi:hypothetical protein
MRGRIMTRTQSIIALVASLMIGLTACSSAGTTSDTPAASSEASPNVQVLDLSDCREDVCEAPLEPGRYRATFYGRTLDFEIPSAGWIWHYFYNFRFIADATPTEGLYTSDSINFLPDPRISRRDCEEAADRTVGHSVSDIVSWLEDAPGLVVSDPVAVDVGGFRGFQLDLGIDPAWRRTCFYSEGLPAVPLITHRAVWGAYTLAMVPGISMRWYVLDTDDGVLIIDIDDGPDNLSYEDLLRTGTEIVDSFEFSATA